MAENFDIEHFPKSEAAQRMMSRITPIYDNSYVGKWIFEVMGIEMDETRKLVESLREQCFLEKCTWGMRYWEERYGIEVDETKDLEMRRAAVLAKRSKKQPMSPATLESILEALTGRNVSVKEYNPHYRFKIQIDEGETTVDYTAVIRKINSVKPSHLAYYIELPHKGTLKLFFAAAIYVTKNIVLKDNDIQDIIELIDENENNLADENMNILVE